MNYALLKDVIDELAEFEEKGHDYPPTVDGFIKWVSVKTLDPALDTEPDWEGKANGRSAESVINTLIVHMNRYAKTYSKSAIHGSAFSTQEEFIYLINLKAFGAMTKMELIKKNVQDKPTGMQILNRLLAQGWIEQQASATDKRSKIIRISERGLKALEQQMDKIRQATKLVTGDLTTSEKMELIRLLNKLDRFHQAIFSQNIHTAKLLSELSDNTDQDG